MLKRTCGILCSDTSIFEILLCQNNNLSSFTVINVWWREFDFSSYLFKFLSVRPQYTRSTKIMRLCFFCIILFFFREMFVLFFGEIFALFFRIIFFAKFSHYFFSHFFAKQIEAKFCERSENFRIFRERTKCENEAKWTRNFFFANAKFLRNDFSFSLETLVLTSHL